LKGKSAETFLKKSAHVFCTVYSPLNFKDFFSETQSIIILRGQHTTLLVFISDPQKGRAWWVVVTHTIILIQRLTIIISVF
jgi:hypothetical protein